VNRALAVTPRSAKNTRYSGPAREMISPMSMVSRPHLEVVVSNSSMPPVAGAGAVVGVVVIMRAPRCSGGLVVAVRSGWSGARAEAGGGGEVGGEESEQDGDAQSPLAQPAQAAHARQQESDSHHEGGSREG